MAKPFTINAPVPLIFIYIPQFLYSCVSTGLPTYCATTTLNQPLSADAFKIPATAGTNVVLFKGSRQEEDLSNVVLRSNTNDVAGMITELRSNDERRMMPARLPAKNSYLWLVGANLLGIFVLVIGLYLRKRNPVR